jgi:hypothetical protein
MRRIVSQPQVLADRQGFQAVFRWAGFRSTMRSIYQKHRSQFMLGLMQSQQLLISSLIDFAERHQ